MIGRWQIDGTKKMFGHIGQKSYLCSRIFIILNNEKGIPTHLRSGSYLFDGQLWKQESVCN
jgi:hypothetical protein